MNALDGTTSEILNEDMMKDNHADEPDAKPPHVALSLGFLHSAAAAW